MSLQVSRVLHAGYIFQCEQTKIIFDPIFENPFSRNCHAFPAMAFNQEAIRRERFDAVFISHFHDDHCSFESLNLIDRSTPIYMFCVFEEMFQLLRELGFQSVHSLDLNRPIQIGSIEIIPRRALDADVDSLFQIKAAGLNVLNVVDSWIDYDTLELLKNESPWDLILWPFQTMRELEVIAPSRSEQAPRELPPEWMKQIKVLSPKAIVPSSCQFSMEEWSWYNKAFFPITYGQFEREIHGILPQTQVVRLNPGVSISLEKNGLKSAAPLSWITPIGDQDIDYDYQSDLKPPSTSEIARHFPLSESERSRVLQYCESELIEKYQSLDAPADPYFEKPRFWQLSLYDDQGKATHFHFKIDGAFLGKASGIKNNLSWTTEVPMAKVYAALELGESLTSMYMRINDIVFDPATEKEIQDADIVEDPLIRCLFNGVFGAYQKAQLQRLRKR